MSKFFNVSVLALWLLVFGSVQAQESLEDRYEDLWPNMKKLLVIAEVESGHHHDSINHAMGVIEQLGRETGEWVTFLRTDSQLITKVPGGGFGQAPRYAGTECDAPYRPCRYKGQFLNIRTLDFFDGIFILASGQGNLDDEQRSALLSFVRDDGKGAIFGHAGSLAWLAWQEGVREILGGAFMRGEIFIETPYIREPTTNFPGADAFPEHFPFYDQAVVWDDNFTSADAEVIIRLDTDALPEEEAARRADGDYPQIYATYFGKGRVFNSALGHREEVWDDPRFRELMTEGIKWALGITEYQLSYPNMDQDR